MVQGNFSGFFIGEEHRHNNRQPWTGCGKNGLRGHFLEWPTSRKKVVIGNLIFELQSASIRQSEGLHCCWHVGYFTVLGMFIFLVLFIVRKAFRAAIRVGKATVHSLHRFLGRVLVSVRFRQGIRG